MMTFFYIGVCLCLIIIQTTIIPYLPLLNRCYDLLIPFIAYLGLSRPLRESLPLVFFLGFIMDNISGSPFGLYLTIYFWVYIGVKGITKLLQVGDRLVIMTLIVVGGVVAENLIFIGTFAVLGPDRQFAADTATEVVFQVAWAVFTGPLLLILFRDTHNWLDAGIKAFYARRNQQG